MAAVSRILRQIDCSEEEVNEYLNQAQLSNYANLLQVSKETLDKHGIEHNFYDEEESPHILKTLFEAIHEPIVIGASDVSSESISGYFYDSVSTHRTAQKSKGRAYCSMWAQSSEGYHSILIDLPE